MTIDNIVAVLKERPQGAKLLVAGDFNVELADPEGDWRGGVNHGGAQYRRVGGYFDPLPPAPALMVLVWEDV